MPNRIIVSHEQGFVNNQLVKILLFSGLYGKLKTILDRIPSCIFPSPMIIFRYKEVIPMIRFTQGSRSRRNPRTALLLFFRSHTFLRNHKPGIETEAIQKISRASQSEKARLTND
ncbi:MAG TPA: hypothetical protein DFH97_01370 [Clostridiales bacterium]|nr:hypothetical protein [Clostridiales bacterium]